VREHKRSIFDVKHFCQLLEDFAGSYPSQRGLKILKRVRSWPYSADMAFAVRDDDLSFFSSIKKMEAIYKKAWDMGFKVSFAVIPMHRAANNLNVPPKFRNDGKYYSINCNKELVEYLKSKISEGKADIAQHGFCHTESLNLPSLKFDFENGALSAGQRPKMVSAQFSEFYGLTEEECREKIQKGRAILERTFDREIKVFVAPQEYLSKNLWKALRKEGLYYCSGASMRSIPVRNMNLPAIFPILLRRSLGKPVFPTGICEISDLPHLIPAYRHYWNKYLDDKLSIHWFNHFREVFAERLKEKENFILTTHYWELFYDWEDQVTQTKQLTFLNRIFDHTNEYNVWKCTLTELFDWTFEGKVP
jgi:hypothetical protein